MFGRALGPPEGGPAGRPVGGGWNGGGMDGVRGIDWLLGGWVCASGWMDGWMGAWVSGLTDGGLTDGRVGNLWQGRSGSSFYAFDFHLVRLGVPWRPNRSENHKMDLHFGLWRPNLETYESCHQNQEI